MFSDYAQHGWKLCPIPYGLKGPTANGWNTPERMVTHPLAAQQLKAAGLCHAYSGTCAIDVDDYELSKVWLKARGVDLDKLFTAPDAVRIVSPRTNAGKLIYRALLPLPSKKISDGNRTILEFRCGTANGLTVQDVLPPSPHPDKSGVIDGSYEWAGDWRNLPELPNKLFEVWQSLISMTNEPGETTPQQDHVRLIEMLKQLHPDMGYDEWLRVGMAIHHEHNGSDEGLRLWDAWSKQGKKYKGLNDLIPHWQSFAAGGGITGNSLVQMMPVSSDEMMGESQLGALAAVQPDAAPAIEDELIYPDTLLAPHDSPPYLVDRLLERSCEASLIGPSKSYKSLWADQLAVCVATGHPFFGRTTEQGLVVMLVGEGAGGIRHRLQALRYGLDIDFSDAPLAVLPRPFAMATEAGVKRVRRAIAAAEQRFNRKLALLIIDTYGRYSSGEENSAEDLYAFFRAASICRANGALLVVHHTGHSDATRGRGTSAWEQAVDTEFVASIRTDTETRTIENTKQKDGETAPPMHFELKRTKTDSTRVGEPVWSVVLEPTAGELPQVKLGGNEKLVYDTIASMSGDTQDDILTAVVAKLPAHDGQGRDKRRENMRRALISLIAKQAVMLHGDRIFKAGDVAAEFAELIGQQ